MTNKERAVKKLEQLKKEFAKAALDWHSIAHLARDLSAVAQAENSKRKI